MPGRGRSPVAGLWRALGLTLASAVVWGIAHIAAGRRTAGFALMGLLALIVFGGATVALAFQEQLKQLVVQGSWLNVIIAGILLLAIGWALVVIRSFQVVRPAGLPAAMKVTSGALVVIMALMVCTPLVYAANATYVLRDTLSSIFSGDEGAGAVNAADPWKNKPRINVLLLGGDGGKDRTGIRTDSMTVASIDTHTGNTVLISLPRALRQFQVAPNMRKVWPNGYTGDHGPNGPCGPSDCLLNELYIQGEKTHPELEPEYGKGQKGPHLLEDEIGYLTGLKMDYYVLVNLDGFKGIVDAMGGITVNVQKSADGRPLPIGGDPDRGIPPSGYLTPGKHHLNGEHALWYGRTRHADDDFHRMDRQKCLMKDIAEQADPQTVVTHFEKLANAAKSTISTNIPVALLPALVKLSGTVKRGAGISSLSYDPAKIPGFHTDRPMDAEILRVMRRAAANAIARSTQPPPNPSTTPTARRTRATPTPGTTSSGGAVSLKTSC